MRYRRFAAAVAAVFSLVVGMGVTAPTQAYAVSCYGDYCSGKDPEATGCAAGAVTISAHQAGYYRLEVRWSPTCKTNWTRLTMYASPWKWGMDGRIYARQDTGYTQSAPFSTRDYATSASTFWTPMIYSPVRRVRGQIVSGGLNVYTGWA
jgi:hypothetical protein